MFRRKKKPEESSFPEEINNPQIELQGINKNTTLEEVVNTIIEHTPMSIPDHPGKVVWLTDHYLALIQDCEYQSPVALNSASDLQKDLQQQMMVVNYMSKKEKHPLSAMNFFIDQVQIEGRKNISYKLLTTIPINDLRNYTWELFTGPLQDVSQAVLTKYFSERLYEK